MSLTAAENEKLADMLMAIQPHVDSLKGNAPSFIKEQIERHREWGANIRLSVKQWDWIKSCYKQVTGEDADADDRGDLEPVDERMEERPPLSAYDDDEIPF